MVHLRSSQQSTFSFSPFLISCSSVMINPVFSPCLMHPPPLRPQTHSQATWRSSSAEPRAINNSSLYNSSAYGTCCHHNLRKNTAVPLPQKFCATLDHLCIQSKCPYVERYQARGYLQLSQKGSFYQLRWQFLYSVLTFLFFAYVQLNSLLTFKSNSLP